MATLEERVSALEQTLASLQGSGLAKNIDDLNHHQMMLLGMGLTARTDINENKGILARLEQDVSILKRGLDRVEEHTGEIEQRLSSLENHVKNFEQSVNSRFDAVDSRFDAQDKALAAQDKKLDQMLLLLTALAPQPGQGTEH